VDFYLLKKLNAGMAFLWIRLWQLCPSLILTWIIFMRKRRFSDIDRYISCFANHAIGALLTISQIRYRFTNALLVITPRWSGCRFLLLTFTN